MLVILEKKLLIFICFNVEDLKTAFEDRTTLLATAKIATVDTTALSWQTVVFHGVVITI